MEQQINNVLKANEQKPVLFEVNYCMTEEFTYDFFQFAFEKRNRGTKIMNLCFGVFFSLMTIIDLLNKNYSHLWFDIFLALLNLIIYPLFLKYAYKKEAKKVMESPLYNQNPNKIVFYDDCFVNVDNQSISTVFYNQLINVYETQKYFYLYHLKTQAYIVPKISFTYNSPDIFRNFIYSKIGSKFKYHM